MTKSFKKVKNNDNKKRTRPVRDGDGPEALQLVDNEDIVNALEANAKDNGLQHLATKKARHDAQIVTQEKEVIIASEKR